MAKMKFTQAAVERIAPPATGRDTWFDNEKSTPEGFGLRVSASGHRSWFLVTRNPATDKQIRVTLGTMGAIPKVDVARQIARDMLHRIKHEGYDPQAAPTVVKTHTITWLVEQFALANEKKGNRTWKNSKGMLTKHLVPVLGGRDVRSITRVDIEDLVYGLKRGGGANRVLSEIRSLFGWAMQPPGRYVPENPAIKIRPPVAETPRERYLSDDEIVRLWKAAETLGADRAGFVRLLLLTGARRSEIAAMAWSELDLARKVFNLPALRSKNKRAHQLPLNHQAMDVLNAIPRTNSPFVFPSTTKPDVSMSPFTGMKLRLDTYLDADGGAKLDDWTFHDLRHTVGTGLAALGVAPGTIALVLNHTGAKSITDRYIHHTYLDVKREALDRWGAHVQGLLVSA